jgi:hypothetical protein
LFGGSSGDDDPAASEAEKGGVAALPATLQFAQWLGNNASRTADGFLDMCFKYSSQSSNALDSFGSTLNKMNGLIQAFINLMNKYSSHKGRHGLASLVRELSETGVRDITTVLDHYVDARVDALIEEHAGSLSATQVAAAVSNRTGASVSALDFSTLNISGAFDLIQKLGEIKQVLPYAFKALKVARKSINKIFKNLNTTMVMLGSNAPPILSMISKLYSLSWGALFVFFVLWTLGLLFYTIWAARWICGHPAAMAAADQEHEEPRGVRERFRSCCLACSACCGRCCDSDLCFWSITILAEVLLLLIFVVCLVVTIAGGLKLFLSAGCSSVWILKDPTVCSGTLNVIKEWLETFWSGKNIQRAANSPLSVACQSESLLTCALIKQELMTAFLQTTLGSALALVCSLLLIIEQARLHERVRWGKIFEELDAEAEKD